MKTEDVVRRLKGWVSGQKVILEVARQMGEPSIAHELLMKDIEFLLNEVERFSKEIVKANEHMDEDYITIQRYKNKLEKCQQNLSIYESF
jgi:prefoldin subunit 5